MYESNMNKAIQQREISSFTQMDAGAYNNDMITSSVNLADTIIGGFFRLIESLIVPLVFLAIFYLIIKAVLVYKSGGGKEASESITNDVKAVFKFLGSIFKAIGKAFSVSANFIWHKKIVIGVLIIFMVIFGVFQRYDIISFLRVQPGQKAVDVSSGKILDPGFYFVSPLVSHYILSHIANYQFDITEITGDSKELQDVILHVNIGFHLDQNQLLDFYKREGAINIWDVSNSIVTPRAIEKIKNTIMNYSFKEVHSKQMEIKAKTMEEIKKSLAPLGIIIDDLNIVNIRIPAKFVDVLGDKEIMDEKIKVVEKELSREKIETEKELEIATRDKQTKIIESEGIAESNRIISEQQITDQMLELKRIENTQLLIQKWNGQVPTNVGGNFSLDK